MSLLTQMLEVDINRKTGVGVRMLSINFMHPASLLTWLELRRMVFDVGKRFRIRMLGNMVCFIITVGGQMFFLISVSLGYLHPKPFVNFWHYIGILIQVSILLMFNVPSLLEASKSNEATED